MTSDRSVIASAAKQSSAGPGRPGLLRCARNDEHLDQPHIIPLYPLRPPFPVAARPETANHDSADCKHIVIDPSSRRHDLPLPAPSADKAETGCRSQGGPHHVQDLSTPHRRPFVRAGVARQRGLCRDDDRFGRRGNPGRRQSGADHRAGQRHRHRDAGQWGISGRRIRRDPHPRSCDGGGPFRPVHDHRRARRYARGGDPVYRLPRPAPYRDDRRPPGDAGCTDRCGNRRRRRCG